MTPPATPSARFYVRTIEQRLRAFTGDPVCFAAGPLDQLDSDYPAERQLVARAGDKRQREFFSGRHVARQAMHRAGVAPAAVLRGPLGNPVWPAPVIGSISHDHTLAAAAVCTGSGIQGLGLDLIEHPEEVTDDLAKLIMNPGELELLSELFPDLPALGVGFSVKESVVKAVSVHLNRYMDLTEIQLVPDKQALSAQLDGFPSPLPCLVSATGIGLLTVCLHRSDSVWKTC